jgi:hypothetical protein
VSIGLVPRVITGAGVVMTACALAAPAHADPAPPPNDARAAAVRLPAVPSTVFGTTAGATADDADPEVCADADAPPTVWYVVPATSSDRRLVVTIDVGGSRDASVAVFARVRSQLADVSCDASDRSGQANVPFEQRARTAYYVAVAPQGDSAPGPFRLRLRPIAPAATPPGARLPAAGTWAVLDPLFRPDTAWHIRLEEGRAYRLAAWSTSNECPRIELFRPPVRTFAAPIATIPCRGYTVVTPRAGSTGRWVVRVSTRLHAAPRFQYRLQVAPALGDDTAPGLPLGNHEVVKGSLSGQGVDRVDLYWFSLRNASELGAQVALPVSAQADLILLSERGSKLRCACESSGPQSLRQILEPGNYFLAVRARGANAFAYSLSRAAREITTTTVTANGTDGAVALPRIPVALTATVTPAPAGGAVAMTIERLDPLAGWLFVRRLDVPVRAGRASVSFLPPAQSRYRVAASFLGTFDSSPSRDTTTFLVWPSSD